MLYSFNTTLSLYTFYFRAFDFKGVVYFIFLCMIVFMVCNITYIRGFSFLKSYFS